MWMDPSSATSRVWLSALPLTSTTILLPANAATKETFLSSWAMTLPPVSMPAMFWIVSACNNRDIERWKAELSRHANNIIGEKGALALPRSSIPLVALICTFSSRSLTGTVPPTVSGGIAPVVVRARHALKLCLLCAFGATRRCGRRPAIAHRVAKLVLCLHCVPPMIALCFGARSHSASALGGGKRRGRAGSKPKSFDAAIIAVVTY